MRANDASYVFTINFKFNRLDMVRVSSKLPGGNASTYVAGENEVILGILNNFQNLFHSAVNFGAGTANKDDIFGRWIVCLSANFDAECFLLADNPTHHWCTQPGQRAKILTH